MSALHWPRRTPLPRLRLRTKVSLFFGLLALVASVSLAAVTYTLARSSLLDQRTRAAEALAISNARKVYDQLRAGGFNEDQIFEDIVRPEQDGFNLAHAEGVTFTADASAADAFPAALTDAVAGGGSGIQRFRFGGQLYLGVGIALPGVNGDYFEAFSLAATERTLSQFRLALSIGSVITVLLAGTVGVWTGRRLLRPLRRVTTAASEIAAGDLSTRVAAEPDPDLEPLVNSFNEMADAVEDRIEREARFASDVSHELRSPITALSAATEVLDGRRDDIAPRTRPVVDVVVSQVKRFEAMVLALLELSRIDAGAADVHVEPVDIALLCRKVASRYGFAELPVVVDAGTATEVAVDRLRFERILANLLQNADIHAGGPVRIAIGSPVSSFVDIAVEDAGPGVDENEREHIFERFAVVPRRCTGSAPGSASPWCPSTRICSAARRGWRSAPGGGARFVVRLPRPADPDEPEEREAAE